MAAGMTTPNPKTKGGYVYVIMAHSERLTVAEAEAIIQVLGLAIPKDFVSGFGIEPRCGRKETTMDIKTIHQSLVEGLYEQAARQIDVFEAANSADPRAEPFFSRYQAWILEHNPHGPSDHHAGLGPMDYYGAATRAYLRLRDKERDAAKEAKIALIRSLGEVTLFLQAALRATDGLSARESELAEVAAKEALELLKSERE